MKRVQALFLCACIPALCALGCDSGSEQRVPTKSDFDKKAPPPEWRGPGQAGAPGGAAGGPPPGSGPVTVPEKILKGGN